MLDEIKDHKVDVSYIHDTAFEHRRPIGLGLRAYNDSHYKRRPFEEHNIYVISQKLVLAGITIEVDWNWATVTRINYKSNEHLKMLLSKSSEILANNVQGIRYSGFDNKIITDMKKNGFSEIGRLVDRPKGFDTLMLIKESFEHVANYIVDDSVDLVISPDKSFEESYRIQKFWNKNYDADSLNEVQFAAIGNSRVIGGIYAVIQHDYLYIDWLWVDEAYRGNQIGTKLIHLIEDYAFKHKINRINLGTHEFQARYFYEKLGYTVNATYMECPEGYEDYIMSKKLK